MTELTMFAIPYPAYRTFWRRVGAGFIDALVLSPIFALQQWLSGGAGPALLAALWVFGYLAVLAYSIALHARYGQTLGKRAAGVMVFDVSGRDITLRQAVLRDLPNILLAALSIAIYVPKLLNGMNPWESVDDPLTTAETAELVIVYSWWGLELITMLTNRKRRSVHDFIASTVVVRRDRLDEVPTLRAEPT